MLLDAATLLQVLIWGFVIGSVYTLLATGLTLVFGVMKVINFAHGELMMTGAFLTFLLGYALGVHPYLGVFFSMIALGFVGIAIERLGFRPLRGTAKINEIFFSIALILILQNALARVFVPYFREYAQIKTPYATDVLDLGLVRLRYDFVVLLTLTWAIMLALYLLLFRTGFGREMRGTSQNRMASMLVGINVERIDMLSFGLGAAMAGAGGSLLSIMFAIYPEMGDLYTLKAFCVVILGGMGHYMGAFLGGLILGLAESVSSLFFSAAIAEGIAYLILVLVLLIKPSGLMGVQE